MKVHGARVATESTQSALVFNVVISKVDGRGWRLAPSEHGVGLKGFLKRSGSEGLPGRHLLSQ